MLLIGTSGYSYNDWVGRFYPTDIRKNAMFDYYSKHFDVVELNFSYFRVPSPYQYLGVLRKAGNTEFVVKAHKSMTHERKRDPRIFDEFNMSLTPLKQKDKLLCVLAQFPSSFHYSEEGMNYLEYLVKKLESPIAMEFRNKDWNRKNVYDFLSKNNVSYCTVDSPNIGDLMPTVAKATSDLGYVRLHGRNGEKWFNARQGFERYDYSYNEKELRELIPKIRKIEKKTEKTLVLFNNHFQAKAAQNAKQFKEMVKEKK